MIGSCLHRLIWSHYNFLYLIFVYCNCNLQVRSKITCHLWCGSSGHGTQYVELRNVNSWLRLSAPITILLFIVYFSNFSACFSFVFSLYNTLGYPGTKEKYWWFNVEYFPFYNHGIFATIEFKVCYYCLSSLCEISLSFCLPFLMLKILVHLYLCWIIRLNILHNL